MATLKIAFNDRQWTLTDEASQCSYGEPVLIDDNGNQLRATEIAIPEMPDELFGKRPPVFAYAVVCHGTRNDGEDISSGDWSAICALLDRYQAQWRRDGGSSPNGVDFVVSRV